MQNSPTKQVQAPPVERQPHDGQEVDHHQSGVRPSLGVADDGDDGHVADRDDQPGPIGQPLPRQEEAPRPRGRRRGRRRARSLGGLRAGRGLARSARCPRRPGRRRAAAPAWNRRIRWAGRFRPWCGSRRPAGAVRLWGVSLTGSETGSGNRSPGQSRSGSSSPSSQPSLRRRRRTAYLTREGASPLGSSQASSISWSDDSTCPWCRAKRGQQAVLGRGQDHRVAVDRDFLVGEVDVEGAVVEGDDRVVSRDLSAADGLEPGQQLDPAERLGQVVVGSGVETPHLVSLGSERGQHEDGHVAHVPDALEHLPAVEVGKTHVEDHDVGMALVELADAVSALVRLGDREALTFEEGPEELADVRLILDDQHGDVTVSHQARNCTGQIGLLSE